MIFNFMQFLILKIELQEVQTCAKSLIFFILISQYGKYFNVASTEKLISPVALDS